MGTATLILGAVSAIALFVQLNLGRTNFDLRWSVPLCWSVLVAAVACIAIALVQIVKIRSFGTDYEDEILTQVGWGYGSSSFAPECSALLRPSWLGRSPRPQRLRPEER